MKLRKVTAALYQRFNSSVHGEYRPGRIVNIVSTQSAGATTYTEQHERFHERFTTASSLGSIAICLELFFKRQPELVNTPGFSDAFLRRYVEDTRAVHEGFAIALGLFYSRLFNSSYFPTEESVRTFHLSFEVSLANRILAWTDEIKRMISAAQLLSEPDETRREVGGWFLQGEILTALGRLVLSPFVTNVAAQSAIRGVDADLDASLCSVWQRLRRVLGTDAKRVAIELMDASGNGNCIQEALVDLVVEVCQAKEVEENSVKRIKLQELLHEGLRTCLSLDFSPSFEIDFLFESWRSGSVDDLNQERERTPPGWDRYAEMCGVHFPQPSSGGKATLNVVLDVRASEPIPGAQTRYLIAEYAIMMIGRQTDEYAKILMAKFTGSGRQNTRLLGPGYELVLALYEFDEQGEYLCTTLVHEPPSVYLRQLPNRGGLVYPAKKTIETPVGMVVSSDDLILSSRFRYNVAGLDLCVVSKRLVPPNEFLSASVLGKAHGATVCRVETNDGRRIWSLVAPGLTKDTKPLDPASGAYAWVMRNGIIAMEKWTMFGLREET